MSLEKAEIDARLEKLDGWKLYNNSLYKEFEFSGFTAAFAFMTEVAKEAKKLNHHPDWSNSFNTVEVSLSTHSAGGVTDADFKLAAKMDELAK